jgi:hypothetical protein
VPGRKRYDNLVTAVDAIDKERKTYLPQSDMGASDLSDRFFSYEVEDFDTLIGLAGGIEELAQSLQEHPHLFKLTKDAATRVVKDAASLKTAAKDARDQLEQYRQQVPEPNESQIQFFASTWYTATTTAFESLYQDVHSPDFKDRHLDAAFVIGR